MPPPSTYRKILTENTRTLHKEKNKQKLQIIEALYIKQKKTTLNKINFEAVNMF